MRKAGYLKEAAFAQARPDHTEIIAVDHPRKRDLFRDTIPGLAGKQKKCRLANGCQRQSRNRSRTDHAWNCARLLQLCVDNGRAPVEVRLAEQRGLKGQQLFTTDTKAGIAQMLKSPQQ